MSRPAPKLAMRPGRAESDATTAAPAGSLSPMHAAAGRRAEQTTDDDRQTTAKKRWDGDPALRAEVSLSVTAMIPTLRRFARSLTRDLTEADDLVQEALVRAISSIHQFVPGTNLKAWLFTILRDTHISLSKRRGRERNITSSLDSSDVGVAPSQPWQMASADFKHALERVPQDQREALMLIGGFGLSYEECALICDCPVGTVKSRLNRGRARLACLLDVNTVDEL